MVSVPVRFAKSACDERFKVYFDFCSIVFACRFRLLQLRDREVPEFKYEKMVPALSREIPPNTFIAYDEKVKREEKLRQKKDIESSRQAVTVYLQRVRDEILQRFREAAHKKSFNDMVNEKEYPTLAVLLPSLFKVVVKRPLHPVRKDRKKVPVHVVTDMKVQVMVSILRAINLPRRLGEKAESGVRTPRLLRFSTEFSLHYIVSLLRCVLKKRKRIK